MSLENLSTTVGKFAPMIGTLLGGPAGGAVGSLVANVLGVGNSDDEILSALTHDPDAAVKIKELETQKQIEFERLLTEQSVAEIQAAVEKLRAVNLTMQTESQSDKWWVSGWRPFWGFTTAIAFFLQVAAIAYLFFSGGHNAPQLINSLASMNIFWTVPLAILGVSAWHRGKEKRIKAGELHKPLNLAEVFND